MHIILFSINKTNYYLKKNYNYDNHNLNNKKII